jgi:ribonuclease J
MSNENNDNKKNDSVTDFSALVPQKNRYNPVKDSVQVALGELRENVAQKSRPPFVRKNDGPTEGGRGAAPRRAPRGPAQSRPPGQSDSYGSDRPNNRRSGGGYDTRRRDSRGPSQNRYPQRAQQQPVAQMKTNAIQNSNLGQLWYSDKVPLLKKDPKIIEGAKLRILPIGGINDVQKNMYVYETESDIVVIDCGMGFADEDMPGVDYLIPDISYLQDKKDKIRAILITHGHDDHIGALPLIWPQLKCPIYASHITTGFIKTKMTEHNLPVEQIVEINPDASYDFGVFKFQFFRLSHSIPDTLGFVMDTPIGRIIHSADFKFDYTPVIGLPTDVQRIAQYGAEGVLLLLSDSLGAEKPGYTQSEMIVEGQFDVVTAKTPGKVIITTTSSNISRIQLAMNIAAKYNRKVAVSGRSMDQNIGVARTLGYLKYSDDMFVELDDIGKYEDQELLLIVAGSQGQMESALGRISRDEHKQIHLRPGDSVIFSTDPIPGNENQTNKLIDTLVAHGAEVYYSNIFSNLHVSGHAAQEELKLMMGLVRPQYLMPIGGTARSTKKYRDIAVNMGFQADAVLLPKEGDVIEFNVKNGYSVPSISGRFETKDVMVDGLGVGDLSEIVIRDRQVMAEEGMLVVIVPVDHKTGHTESGVEIVSRGFVYMKESTQLIDDITKLVEDILEEQHGKPMDWTLLRKKIEDRVSKFIFKEIKRKPMVLPVVFEV